MLVDLCLSGCGSADSGVPDARARARMPPSELKALCWHLASLALQFASKPFVVPNQRVGRLLTASLGELISWDAPSQTGRLQGQASVDVPMPVSHVTLWPATDGGDALTEGRLIELAFRDTTLSAAARDRPSDYRSTRLDGCNGVLADMVDVLTVAKDVGKEPDSIYFSGRVTFIQAGCTSDPDRVEESDRLIGLTANCMVSWSEPALPRPREIDVIAEMSIKPEPQRAAARADWSVATPV